jgi:hypothetical protein
MTKYPYGQRVFLKKGMGKPKVAYVVSKDDDYLVKLAPEFPYKPGDKHFFVHIAILEKNWRHESDGIQQNLQF